MTRIITQGMIERYVLSILKNDFAEKKELQFEFGLEVKNKKNNNHASTSFIFVGNIGSIFYSPFDGNFYYHGGYPGDDFFGKIILRFKTSFQCTLPPRIASLLEEVFTLKTAKTVEFSHQLEEELFKA